MCLNVAHVQADTNMKNSPGWCCEKMKKFGVHTTLVIFVIALKRVNDEQRSLE